MNASYLNSGERVRDVHVTEDTLAVDLANGRTIIVPLTWSPAFERNHGTAISLENKRSGLWDSLAGD